MLKTIGAHSCSFKKILQEAGKSNSDSACNEFVGTKRIIVVVFFYNVSHSYNKKWRIIARGK